MTESIVFTEARIRSLPPSQPGTRNTYTDNRVPGLLLRVTHRGVKSFSLRRWINGKAERITLGKWPQMTFEDAKRKAAQLNGEIASGSNPGDLKRALKAEPTFADLFAEWMRRHGNTLRWKATRNGEPISHAQYLYDRHLAARFGCRKVSTITRRDISSIFQEITSAGHRTTANHIVAIISSVFTRSIEWGTAESNPAKGIRKNPIKSRDRFLTAEELPRFVEALIQYPISETRGFIWLAVLTGARRSNVCAMSWADINLESRTWRIERTKNGESQVITLSPWAVQVLESLRAEAAPDAVWVLPGRGKTGHIVEPKKALASILKTAGIQGVRIHDLRRTLGSWLAMTGASLRIVGGSLGQKSLQSAAIYARLELDPVRHAVDKANAAMMSAAGLDMGPRVATNTTTHSK